MRIKDIIDNSIDVEYIQTKSKSHLMRKVSKMFIPNINNACVLWSSKYYGKDYSVKTLINELKGIAKNKAYIYSLEEIELSDGHNEAVESEPTPSPTGLFRWHRYWKMLEKQWIPAINSSKIHKTLFFASEDSSVDKDVTNLDQYNPADTARRTAYEGALVKHRTPAEVYMAKLSTLFCTKKKRPRIQTLVPLKEVGFSTMAQFLSTKLII